MLEYFSNLKRRIFVERQVSFIKFLNSLWNVIDRGEVGKDLIIDEYRNILEIISTKIDEDIYMAQLRLRENSRL
jgi:hypothetical protein